MLPISQILLACYYRETCTRTLLHYGVSCFILASPSSPRTSFLDHLRVVEDFNYWRKYLCHCHTYWGVMLIETSKSFVHRMNGRGPKHDPCGMPQDDFQFFGVFPTKAAIWSKTGQMTVSKPCQFLSNDTIFLQISQQYIMANGIKSFSVVKAQLPWFLIKGTHTQHFVFALRSCIVT